MRRTAKIYSQGWDRRSLDPPFAGPVHFVNTAPSRGLPNTAFGIDASNIDALNIDEVL